MLAIPFQNAVNENVFDAISANLAIHDIDQNIVWANKAYCKAIGRSLQEIQGKKCYSIWGLANPCQGCPVASAIETGEQTEGELTPWNQDRWPVAQGSWLSKAAPLRDAEGIIIGAVETTFEITGIKETLKEREQRLHDKGERVKELQCLYSVAESIQKATSLEEIFQGAVKHLPAGWHYPDITRGKIIFRGKEYVSEPFLETKWKQSATIIVNGKSLVSIEVYYLEECPEMDEGPFMKEERDLIEGLSIIIRNAIERKQAEEDLVNLNLELENRVCQRTEELNVTQKMLKYAFDYSPIGKTLVALDGHFISANEMLCRILGYTKEELLTKTFQELTHPDDLEADLAYVKQLLAGESNEYEMEKRYMHKQGQPIWAQLNVSLVQDSDRQPLFFISQIQDISRRKETEEELRESERRFRDIIQSMADWIWEVDKNCKYTYVSDSVKNVLGYTAEELLGKTPFEIMPGEEAAKIKEIFLEILSRSGPIVDLENWNLAKDGTEICFITNGVPVFNADREFIGYRGVDKNITIRKKLETQVQQAQKMEVIGTLAGGIAHDFNNILSPIIGHAELLLMDAPVDSPSIGNLKAINTAALRAKDLIRQILTFSRQDRLESIMMKMQPIVKEALKLIRSTIPKTIEIKNDINPDGGIIRADPTQIHQIVMNLVTNACHAMEETGGDLRVGLKEIEIDKQDMLSQIMEPGVYACLTIADTGIGMNKELTQKIFDPFFTTKAKGKGTGMGLSVVYGIVNKMGGTIRVYSEPGKGSEFKVYFPVDKRYSKEQSVQPKEPIPCGNEQILLVDDEEPILTMEKQVLERLGYQVTSRTSSLEALEAFRANPDRFDLVITDTAMPNMPGDKLSGELIKIRPDIPILLCTGFSQTMSEEKAASLGIKGFLFKPMVMRDLAQKIREVLE